MHIKSMFWCACSERSRPVEHHSSVFFSQLSEGYLVQWQLDAYVDHLRGETRFANFTYHDQRLPLLMLFLFYASFLQFNLLYSACRSEPSSLLTLRSSVFTGPSLSACLNSTLCKTLCQATIRSEFGILLTLFQGLSVGKATVTFL